MDTKKELLELQIRNCKRERKINDVKYAALCLAAGGLVYAFYRIGVSDGIFMAGEALFQDVLNNSNGTGEGEA